MLEILKNISLLITSVIVIIGIIFSYWKIWNNSLKVKSINEKIEKEKEFLVKKKIKGIEADFGLDINWGDNKKEKRETRKIEHKIEKLEREKQYLLEEISIYKIFKK